MEMRDRRCGRCGTDEITTKCVLVTWPNNPETKTDLWVLPMQGDRKPTPFLRTEFNERSGQFSPDGHWIAYISDESGSDEIYVREFSSGSAQGSGDAAGKWLISKGGGTYPRWQGDGKELFYVASGGKLTSVDISAKPVFQAGVPLETHPESPPNGKDVSISLAASRRKTGGGCVKRS
jgi:hypothetical protein